MGRSLTISGALRSGPSAKILKGPRVLRRLLARMCYIYMYVCIPSDVFYMDSAISGGVWLLFRI